jgi:hypothetical protein
LSVRTDPLPSTDARDAGRLVLQVSCRDGTPLAVSGDIIGTPYEALVRGQGSDRTGGGRKGFAYRCRRENPPLDGGAMVAVVLQ